jgi:hypothetical protein
VVLIRSFYRGLLVILRFVICGVLFLVVVFFLMFAVIDAFWSARLFGCFLLVSMAISDPDFGFGVDPGRLRGYPLAHLAGTWW